ncbi:hypothetical protein ACWDBO_54895 [Streptomyces mirabilis]|uniref:hypothetical protein n=1 Tax=Streptomyces TaxID=1883 RepID=UPI0029A78D56|nr:hypothetical protein [Streptomyces sp. AK02-04a]MDX3763967.1 hypothetical protein [Streptomyces sp. AK02-04a]
MTDDAGGWQQLADLLPPVDAQEVMDCWAIGEQEAGLDILVASLLRRETPISDRSRAQLAVTAEVWGQREALEPKIIQCRRHADGDGDVRVIAPADAVSVPGPVIGSQRELAEQLVVPWIACTSCQQVLGRAHTREPWGDLSYLATHYVLFSPGAVARTRLFGPSAANEAFAALISCTICQ